MTQPGESAVPGHVFAEPWQAQLFALTVGLSEAGHFAWPDWSAAFGAALGQASEAGAPSDGSAYYDVWLDALEGFLIERDLASGGALADLRTRWVCAYETTPHGHPVRLAD